MEDLKTQVAIVQNDLKHSASALGRIQKQLVEIDTRIRDLEEVEHDYGSFKDTVFSKFREVATQITCIETEADSNKDEIKTAKLWIKIIKSVVGVAFVAVFYLMSNIADVNNFLTGVQTLAEQKDIKNGE